MDWIFLLTPTTDKVNYWECLWTIKWNLDSFVYLLEDQEDYKCLLCMLSRLWVGIFYLILLAVCTPLAIPLQQLHFLFSIRGSVPRWAAAMRGQEKFSFERLERKKTEIKTERQYHIWSQDNNLIYFTDLDSVGFITQLSQILLLWSLPSVPCWCSSGKYRPQLLFWKLLWRMGKQLSIKLRAEEEEIVNEP